MAYVGGFAWAHGVAYVHGIDKAFDSHGLAYVYGLGFWIGPWGGLDRWVHLHLWFGQGPWGGLVCGFIYFYVELAKAHQVAYVCGLAYVYGHGFARAHGHVFGLAYFYGLGKAHWLAHVWVCL